MISTVTTTTVTTVTTATVALSAGLSLLAIFTLLGVLIPKEILSVNDRPALKTLYRAMDIALVPLLIGFVLIAAVQIFELLR